MYGRSVSANRAGTVGVRGRDTRGSRRRLAGTHTADDKPQGDKGEDSEDEEGRIREKSGADILEVARRPAVGPDISAYCVTAVADGESGSGDLTRRGSGAERKRAYATNMTAAGRGKKGKKKHISVVSGPS